MKKPTIFPSYVTEKLNSSRLVYNPLRGRLMTLKISDNRVHFQIIVFPLRIEFQIKYFLRAGLQPYTIKDSNFSGSTNSSEVINIFF